MPQFTANIFICSTDVIFIGAYAFTIRASDPENDRLTYKLTEPNAVLFSVNENTGDVSVKRQLDREVWCDVVEKPVNCH